MKALTDQGIRLGVKVDLGWLIMPGTMGEMTTQGKLSIQYILLFALCWN